MPIAKTKEEWWALVRADLSKWNTQNHPDDRMGIQDWIGEVGPIIHGGIAFRDQYGDWDVKLASLESRLLDYEDDDDLEDDEYF